MLITTISLILLLALLYMNYRWYAGFLKRHDKLALNNIESAETEGPFDKTYVEKEEATRRMWLTSLLVNVGITMINTLLLIFAEKPESFDFIEYTGPLPFIVGSIFFVSLICFIATKIERYYAYKKRGTKWLVVLLLFGAISMIAMPIQVYIAYGTKYLPLLLTEYTLGFIASFFRLYTSFNLYKVNAKRKHLLRNLPT